MRQWRILSCARAGAGDSSPPRPQRPGPAGTTTFTDWFKVGSAVLEDWDITGVARRSAQDPHPAEAHRLLAAAAPDHGSLSEAVLGLRHGHHQGPLGDGRQACERRVHGAQLQDRGRARPGGHRSRRSRQLRSHPVDGLGIDGLAVGQLPRRPAAGRSRCAPRTRCCSARSTTTTRARAPTSPSPPSTCRSTRRCPTCCSCAPS